ncbi:hypothetical protein AMS68_002070 [Peltaster fructicola]|uniref:L-gulonate 3-dehydrogenase n=1 Tax=Peltaster fructicola TaxID=286661 RepID=A0A6H0XPA7_9PEZI|nr:hypothetical protein AMS68_002070 [Peltaster fructicola]
MSTARDKIAIIGSGTIGLSFAALHLRQNPAAEVVIFDTRHDLDVYSKRNLPGYLLDADATECMQRLSIASTLEEAVKNADIVQEQGPEDPDFKVTIWSQIEQHAPETALLWSSTSGIPASMQSREMQDKTRLLVVHPFNPPHIMPLLEVVPSPLSSGDIVTRTVAYWKKLGRAPVVLRQECKGFVANRLAFALLREACSLVTQGVVSVEELDEIVQTSMGPRWAIAGPFKSYHAGGGEGGLKSFMAKLGGTIQEVWKTSEEDIRSGDIKIGSSWQDLVCMQADEAYGEIDIAERDDKTRRVLAAVQGESSNGY